MTKLYDVWYDYKPVDGKYRFPVHVHVVAEDILDAINVVKFNADKDQIDIDVFSIKQESETVFT